MVDTSATGGVPPQNIAQARTMLLVLGIALGEFVIHYHVDWAKEQVGRRLNATPQTSLYWHALGIDQLLHGLTYVGIVAVLVWAMY